jgi:hypothetical protein
METALIFTVLGVLLIGRLYATQLVTDFIAGLPAAERARIRRSLSRGTC